MNHYTSNQIWSNYTKLQAYRRVKNSEEPTAEEELVAIPLRISYEGEVDIFLR